MGQRGHRVASQQERLGLPCSAQIGQADTVLSCESPDIWLQPQSARYRGLHVPRPQTWDEIQEHVDALANPGFLRRSLFPLKETVFVGLKSNSELAVALSAGAKRLVLPLDESS